MNCFQSTYDQRLREWKNLRLIARTLPLAQACEEIDKWWQQAPLINHHLHWADSDNWPDPWNMLSENTYCTLTRALGMCYTLILSDIYDIELVNALDENCEEHNLVVVGRAKYIINYWPNTALSTTLDNFKIIRNISLEKIKNI